MKTHSIARFDGGPLAGDALIATPFMQQTRSEVFVRQKAVDIVTTKPSGMYSRPRAACCGYLSNEVFKAERGSLAPWLALVSAYRERNIYSIAKRTILAG
ncbi:hypothetical protein GCM10028792_36280 [Salinisphaera aquimarina]